jgi:hypothetical protein
MNWLPLPYLLEEKLRYPLNFYDSIRAVPVLHSLGAPQGPVTNSRWVIGVQTSTTPTPLLIWALLAAS